MENKSYKNVLDYTERFLLGIISVNFCIIDRRPDLMQYHNLRKYIHVTTVYVFGFPVFETESVSMTIGTFRRNFNIECDLKDKTLEHLQNDYKEIYKNDSYLKG